jgi:hypothetical protein
MSEARVEGSGCLFMGLSFLVTGGYSTNVFGFLFLNLHQIVYFFNFVVSFVFVNSTKSCQFGLIENFTLLYDGVWQSSCKAFITMLELT